MAILFTGTTCRGLDLQDTHAACYYRRRDIPAHLKPASWFYPASWYRQALRAGAAYVGRRQAYPLYPVSEKRRLDRRFRLRLVAVADTDIVASRTQWRRLGYPPPPA